MLAHEGARDRARCRLLAQPRLRHVEHLSRLRGSEELRRAHRVTPTLALGRTRPILILERVSVRSIDPAREFSKDVDDDAVLRCGNNGGCRFAKSAKPRADSMEPRCRSGTAAVRARRVAAILAERSCRAAAGWQTRHETAGAITDTPMSTSVGPPAMRRLVARVVCVVAPPRSCRSATSGRVVSAAAAVAASSCWCRAATSGRVVEASPTSPTPPPESPARRASVTAVLRAGRTRAGSDRG